MTHEKLGFFVLACVTQLSVACGGGELTHRFVDTPQGTSYQLGTPKNKTYSAEIATAKDQFHIRAYEHAECDKIRFAVVSRTEQTLRGDEVVETQPMGQVQVVEATEPPVPCNDRFATGAEVALSAGTATYVLGRTDRFGELQAGLSEELQQSLYDEATPVQMKVQIERQDVATLSMAELAKHEQRAASLAGELKAILDLPSPGPADVSRSYVLFEQLQQLNRDTAEIRGLSQRFLERVYQRKSAEATERLRHNLDALKGAKELLGTSAAVAVPAFVRASITGGTPSDQVVQWALGQVALAVQGRPSLCSGSFSWQNVTPDMNVNSRIAFGIARYQYNEAFPARVHALCGR